MSWRKDLVYHMAARASDEDVLHREEQQLFNECARHVTNNVHADAVLDLLSRHPGALTRVSRFN